MLIAEQFRSDYLFRNFNAFSNGGFRRLMDEAAFFPDCRLLSSTFTCTGLATISTGSYASMHGIVADRWYESAGHHLKAVEPSDLAIPTFFQEDPQAANRFFCIAANESKAGLLKPGAGNGLFFRKADSTFATAGTGPPWLADFNRAHAAEKLQNQPWTAHGAGPNSVPLRSLTYDASKPGNFQALLASSPFAQTAEINLVREIIRAENLGATSFDTVVAILDSIGKLGSETGAISPLIDDEVLSLDADIAALLDWLDATRLSYQIVFTAAHGAPAFTPHGPLATYRVAPGQIVDAVETALASEFGKGKPNFRFVESYVYPFLYLRNDHLTPADLPRARQIAGKAAISTGRVYSFMTADGYGPQSGDWSVRARNSLYPGRSGDLLLSYKPGSVEAGGSDRGISYGSLWNYDSQIPLLLKGPSFIPGRFDHTVELTDIAPTLAAVSGMPPPAGATGRILTEAFGEGAS